MTSAEAFYEDFSLQVGARDWRSPNPRHVLLRLLVDERLRGCRGLRLLDVGCGAGVMSAHLRRYGAVTAIDFSAPAIALGRALAPDVRFEVGPADRLPVGERFHVVTLFDVLEHIPTVDRPAVLAQVAERLTDDGQVILSTPHARFTRWLEHDAPELMQAVDEPVEIADLLELAAAHDLVLDAYETYDIDWTGPQYQLVVLRRAQAPGVRVPTPRTRHVAALRRLVHPVSGVARRLRLVSAALRSGRPRAALWLLSGRGAPPA